MLYRRAAIIGIGQIGASFALAGKRAGVLGHVTGVARSQQTLDTALEVGAADACTDDATAAVTDADLVYLAVPVGAMRQVMSDIVPHLATGCLVTDAGSTKARICAWAAEVLGDEVVFIGGHPMAGSERRGPGSASAELFADTTYLLCPGSAPQPAVDEFQELIAAIGARPLLIDPQRHDQIVALSSHLPHLCSVALSLALSRGEADELATFGAGGLRDTTRIAAADVELWRDIFAANADNLLPAAEKLREALDELIGAITAGDWDQVAELLGAARSFRDGLYGDGGNQ